MADQQTRACDKKLTDDLHALKGEFNALTERVSALDRLMEAKFVTFKVLVDSQAEKVLLALNAADKAVSKAEIATEKRFESVNEFRSSLSDQALNLVSKLEFTAVTKGLSDKLSDLADRINRSEGKGSGLHAGWGYIVGGIGVFAAVVAVITGLGS